MGPEVFCIVSRSRGLIRVAIVLIASGDELFRIGSVVVSLLVDRIDLTIDLVHITEVDVFEEVCGLFVATVMREVFGLGNGPDFLRLDGSFPQRFLQQEIGIDECVFNFFRGSRIEDGDFGLDFDIDVGFDNGRVGKYFFAVQDRVGELKVLDFGNGIGTVDPSEVAYSVRAVVTSRNLVVATISTEERGIHAFAAEQSIVTRSTAERVVVLPPQEDVIVAPRPRAYRLRVRPEADLRPACQTVARPPDRSR